MTNNNIKDGSYHFDSKKLELTKTDSYGELCKEFYFYEKTRKNDFKSETISYLSILTLIYICLIFFIQNISIFVEYKDGVNVGYNLGFLFYFFIISFFVTFIFSFVSLYFFIKSLYGHKSSYLPELIDLEKHIDELRTYYLGWYWINYYSYQEITDLFETHVKNQIISYYKECAFNDNNFNNEKAELKRKYLNNLITSGIILFISSIPFFIQYNLTDPSIQMIDIAQKDSILKKIKDMIELDYDSKYLNILDDYKKIKSENIKLKKIISEKVKK